MNGEFSRVLTRSPIGGCSTVQKNTDGQIADELALLKRLSVHPNIVRTFFEASTPHTLVLEACTTSLEDVLVSRLPFDLKAVAVCTLQALAYMHLLGVAHNDIKPGNLLLGPDRRTWKVCDFGNATLMHTNHLCLPNHEYTMSYAAPELVWAVDRRCDIDGAKADMWSFAVTMLHAACQGEERSALFERLSGVIVLHVMFASSETPALGCFRTATCFPCLQPPLQSIIKHMPDLAKQMSHLLSVFADDRPEAQALLKFLLS